MPDHDWNANDATGFMPWDSDAPDPALVATVEAGTISAGRALEVGCGTGTNAIWLAARGFDVLGVDVASLAIDRSRTKLGDTAHACRFEVRGFLKNPPQGVFDFVFDRGCFHVFDAPRVRARFAARVAGVLAPGGLWLSLIGSTEGAPSDFGPPRRSARDIASAVEPVLQIVELRAIHFEMSVDMPPAAWLCLSRVRGCPAQPSTAP